MVTHGSDADRTDVTNKKCDAVTDMDCHCVTVGCDMVAHKGREISAAAKCQDGRSVLIIFPEMYT